MTYDEALVFIESHFHLCEELETYSLTKPPLSEVPTIFAATAVLVFCVSGSLVFASHYGIDVDAGALSQSLVVLLAAFFVARALAEGTAGAARAAKVRQLGSLVNPNGSLSAQGQAVVDVLGDLRKHPVAFSASVGPEQALKEAIKNRRCVLTQSQLDGPAETPRTLRRRRKSQGTRRVEP